MAGGSPAASPLSGWSFSASAIRLDPTVRKGPAALGPETLVEREAWDMYDAVGEVGQMVSSSAGLLAQCTLYAGFVKAGKEIRLRGEDGKPNGEFDEQFIADAEAILARFVDTGGSQRGLLLAIAENFDVTGACYLVGWSIDAQGEPVEDDDRNRVAERWEAVGRSALDKVHGHWKIMLAADKIVELPASAVVYRFWRKHPRRPNETRAWVIQALDICRDLRVFTLAQRSAARSGIPAKILVAANEASPKNLTPATPMNAGQVAPPSSPLWQPQPGIFGQSPIQGPGGGTARPETWASTLEMLIGNSVMEVLRDAQSGRAVVPAVLTVGKDFVDKWYQIDLSRPIDTALAGLVDQARARLAEVGDGPPEMLRGLGQTNRWNGAQIADDEFRRYFRPKAMAIADAWTVELLWDGLLALGHPRELVQQVRVLVDARGVVADPDRSKAATDGLKLGAVSYEAWRAACGFSEEDAPSPEEQKMLLDAFGAKASSTGANMPGDVNTQAGSAIPHDVPTDREVPPEELAEVDRVVRAQVLPPLSKLHQRSAAAIPHRLTHAELAHQLAIVEDLARVRLEEAAEAAFEAAIARGGSKLKTWARNDANLRALLADCTGAAVPDALGYQVATTLARARFGTDDKQRREDMFAAALAGLLASFSRIVHGTYERALGLLGDAAALAVTAERIAGNIARASEVLRSSMMMLADRRLFEPTRQPQLGELSTLRVPTPITRRALASAGGAQVEPGIAPDEATTPGLVFGPTLAEYQPQRVGFVWVYGAGARARPYEPHQEVDGQTFSGEDDPALDGLAPDGGPGFPGDHDGCLCSWEPVYVDDNAES